jgi:hypothetical protein
MGRKGEWGGLDPDPDSHESRSTTLVLIFKLL